MVYEALYEYDDDMRRQYGDICGVDEAGRGPLAGPVVCAAVVLPPHARFDALTDSKKLSEKQRERLFNEIVAQATAHKIVVVGNDTIDRVNILAATMQGMKAAINALKTPAAAFVDGNRVPDADIPCVAVVKGDATSASIAAASVLAKVTRDRIMTDYDIVYPEYGFAQHKGYPTKAHYDAVRAYGLIEIHRKTFFKKNPEILQTADIGKQGEQAAQAYLAQNGYAIVARNYKTRTGEVDIVADKGGFRVFVEVKTRARGSLVPGVYSVDRRKQQRILSAAQALLQEQPTELQPRLDYIEVVHEDGGFSVTDHIENAFDAQETYP